MYYGEKPTCAAAFDGAKEHTILVHSLSKTYAMTGWRVGYLAAPAQVIENALKAGQNSITCVAPFIQKAAAFALTDAGIQQAVIEMRASYAQRRQVVLRVAREAGELPVHVAPPMGAFYFFLDLRALNISSQEICERLLEEAGVGVVSGAAFGAQGEGFVRMTIAAPESGSGSGYAGNPGLGGKGGRLSMRVAFQGEAGAYSEQAVYGYFGKVEAVPCESFDLVFEFVELGKCETGMIPIENSLAGSIHQNYDLLLKNDLHITGEYFLRVRHCLIGLPGAQKTDIKKAISHPQALGQCAGYLKDARHQIRGRFRYRRQCKDAQGIRRTRHGRDCLPPGCRNIRNADPRRGHRRQPSKTIRVSSALLLKPLSPPCRGQDLDCVYVEESTGRFIQCPACFCPAQY